MIPMSQTLQDEVKRPRHTPFVRLTVRDRQFRWAAIHGDGENSQYQTALALTDGVWLRARLGPGGEFQTQRITDPADPDKWLAWTALLPSGALNDVAVSADGDLARAFCIVNESGLWRVKAWTSSDGGVTWGGPAVAAESSSAVTRLASPAPDSIAYSLDAGARHATMLTDMATSSGFFNGQLQSWQQLPETLISTATGCMKQGTALVETKLLTDVDY